MATRIDPKVEARAIPITSGWTTWLTLTDLLLVVAIETPVQWTAANLAIKARMRSAGAGGVVYDDNPNHGGR